MRFITTLHDLIAQVESANNPFAIRYEPAWSYAVPSDIRAAEIAHGCDETTALALMSCSWGLYQIMGSVLYDLGASHLNLLRDYLPNAPAQTTMFFHFLEEYCPPVTIDDIREGNAAALAFAARYNGNGPEYLKRCRDVLKAFT